jgi:hypothetical protein
MSADCRCMSLPVGPMKTDHQDEVITIDTVQVLGFRCRLCDRKMSVQYVPSDSTIGGKGDRIGLGSDGIILAEPGSKSEARKHAPMSYLDLGPEFDQPEDRSPSAEQFRSEDQARDVVDELKRALQPLTSVQQREIIAEIAAWGVFKNFTSRGFLKGDGPPDSL